MSGTTPGRDGIVWPASSSEASSAAIKSAMASAKAAPVRRRPGRQPRTGWRGMNLAAESGKGFLDPGARILAHGFGIEHQGRFRIDHPGEGRIEIG